jgi:Animal haem peroxidase
LAGELIKVLWNNLEHPPLSYQGDNYKYRMADGSNNNVMYPQLGSAASPYARTVTPQTLQPGVLPDPSVIFDAVFAREGQGREHPNRLSSMLFYWATIIIHDIFHTDESDDSRSKTSSYLDLAPLYGSSQADQNKVRALVDGLLKPDTYSESRVLGFPPGVSALLICFNRYHNYVAQQLKLINEGDRFPILGDKSSKEDIAKLDNDLFQTARLVTCGLYINITLNDYVRTILNLNRSKSTWALDPRSNDFADVFDSQGVPIGVGNQVSAEFNLVYRWHSAISRKDEAWTQDLYRELFGKDVDISELSEKDLITGLQEWAMKQNRDPSKWPLDNGKYKRNARGAFEDSDLINILADATEDVACAFGPRNVPVVMKLIDVMGMKQARKWKLATLNEFRAFFKLEPHKTFSDITKDDDVANSLATLYTHPDYVELYPGLVAEDAKVPLVPGSGLCPGFTISRTILADAVALTRGDRFYTIDYTPANLTNWGWNQVKSDTDVAGGGVMYNLLMRALPFWYRGNSVYAMYPFTVPKENKKILETLQTADKYDFGRPSYIGVPPAVSTWKGVTDLLADQTRFVVPWGPHIKHLTGHDYMLGVDNAEGAVQKSFITDAIYCPVNGLEEVRKFYEDLTTQLVETRSKRLRGDWFQLDAVRDVLNPSHAIFVARMFHLPLKSPGDMKIGATVDDLYLAFSVLFAYVFLDLDTARSFKLRTGAEQATAQVSKLVKLVCEFVSLGKHFHVDHFFAMGTAGKLLSDYGTKLLLRFFGDRESVDGKKSVEEVVAALLPTMAAAICTQAQHSSQMIDLYLTEPYYSEHWAKIQECAQSNDPECFEKLKSYALEANRLAPAAYGSLRTVNVECDVHDGQNTFHVKKGDQVYTDFVAAGLDESVFKDAHEIKLDRDRTLYIHQGWGPHRCLGRPIVEVAMAAQLKVFAKLKNLKRAPGPQGGLKGGNTEGKLKSEIPSANPEGSEPQKAPGQIKVFMKEDYSDWWPFPASELALSPDALIIY